MDEDLAAMSHAELVAEVTRLREGVSKEFSGSPLRNNRT
jgi:hypothetical protein